ncbi:DNA repair exonuclease [Candidatus Marsarchaeota archaeon]|jgi:DNA repair exonuclease SbcCD nuclease subunit|nr:DNA repair exonuclease [Candidatus Marsarchaeota archaeon]
MKIAIVSDMHIGYERFYDDAYEQAREALAKAASMADVILLPGDIFDKRAPKPEVIAQALSLFRELNGAEWKTDVKWFRGQGRDFSSAPIVAISGTHERTAAGKENPLGLLALAGLLIDASESQVLLEKDGERVAVYGLGGLSEERVVDKLKELDPKPVEGAFNVFMLHQSIYEILPFDNSFMHYDDLPKGFDLYVCGHIHSRVKATVHGKLFLIPGSTVLTQLKEGEQEKKGFILFDTQKYSYEFIEIGSRPFIVKRLKFENASIAEVRKKCDEAIAECVAGREKKPIVKLYLEGTFELGGSSELGLRALIMKHAGDAILEMDTSGLKEPEIEKSIEGIRENSIDSVGIKDIGMQLLRSRLKELGFKDAINVEELFEILSDQKTSKKDKIIENALKFLEEDP